jgi:ABC-type uncharacterized transport system substrate-binding protein
MNRRKFLGALTVNLLAAPLAAEAQRAPTARRVAFLGADSPSTTPHFVDAFRQGMRDHGYVDGRNVTIEVRWAEGRSERFPGLVEGLLRLKPDVIVAVSLPAALAARNATTTIPVVFIAGHPLGVGLVSNLARPGGNLTGLSLFLGDEFSGKWLEFLKEAVPGASIVGIIWNPTNPANVAYLSAIRNAAQTLGVKLQPEGVRTPDEFEPAFASIKRGRAQALIVLQDPLAVSYRAQIVELAAKHRMPAMYGFREFADAGGLMAYGVNVADLCRRAATYVDKILKGTKPGDLPVEQPTRFDFVINLRTARALGLAIPPSLRLRADQILE